MSADSALPEPEGGGGGGGVDLYRGASACGVLARAALLQEQVPQVSITCTEWGIYTFFTLKIVCIIKQTFGHIGREL